MPKESKNVDKRCAFSSLVRSYAHVYAMNDKCKVTLMCGTANCIRSHFFVRPHITLERHSHVI